MATKLRRIDIREFKTLANGEGAIPDDVMLTKDCSAEVKAVDTARREVSIVFSTESVDRDGDIIYQRGIDLRAYRQNPVVLFAHNYSDLPIARSMKIFQTEGRTRSVSIDRFADRDLNPLADTVFRMLTHETPFLNAASIGFRPVKFERREVDEEESQQFFMPASFSKVEKLEHSIVPVPANSEALMGAKSVGIDLGPVAVWAARVLDEGIKSGSMTREHIERCWDICNREVRSFVVPNSEGVDDGQGDVVLMDHKGTTPPNPPNSGKQPPEAEWSAPSLSDFTDGVFDDLSASERRAIARHYTWAEMMPPEVFGQLKLPHHDATSHAVNLRGVNAALAVLNGARGGVDIPSGDKDPAGAHLNSHRRQFGLDPIEIRSMEEAEMKEFLERLAKEIADNEKTSVEDARKALDAAIAIAVGEAKKEPEAEKWSKDELAAVVGKAIEALRSKADPEPEKAPAVAPAPSPAPEPKAADAKDGEAEFEFPSIKEEDEARKASVDEQVSEIRTGQRQILGLLKQVVDVLMSITVSDESEDVIVEDEDGDEKNVADGEVALMLEDDEPEAQDGKSDGGNDILAFISKETANAVTRALEERSGRLPN